MRPGQRLVEWDWVDTATAERLHHVTLTDEEAKEFTHNSQLEETTVTATCGRTLYWPAIPSISSRLSMPRCQRCCSRLGYPQGDGSPKNDSACQPLVEARIDAS